MCYAAFNSTIILLLFQDDGVTWSAKPLTVLHNSDNKKEMSRLLAEHPGEGETIVRNERLLGQLIPLRAFGDVRFKWSADGKWMCDDMGMLLMLTMFIFISWLNLNMAVS